MTIKQDPQILGVIMSSEHENNLRLHQLQLRGKLLAGFTHEMKNHLAVIGESNGLIEDYLMMGKIEDKELSDKLNKICSKIQERLQKTTEMSQFLNSFSHRTDAEISTFSLNEFVEEQFIFLERYARLRKVKLLAALPEETLALETDPSLLQFMLTRIFFVLLEHTCRVDDQIIQFTIYRENGYLHISLSQQEGNIEKCGPTADIRLDEEEKLALDKLNAELNFSVDGEGKTTINLILDGAVSR